MTEKDYETLLQTWEPAIGAIARKRLVVGYDYEDIVNELRLKLWQISDKIDQTKNPHAFISSALANRAQDLQRNYLTRSYRSVSDAEDIDHFVFVRGDPRVRLDRKLQREANIKRVEGSNLTQRQQDAVVSLLRGESRADQATRHNCTSHAVMRRLQRACGRLRDDGVFDDLLEGR